MFSIEHKFDATVVTLVDDGAAPLREDVIIRARADRIEVEQFDPQAGAVRKVTLSPEQMRDLAAAINLPEGVYLSAARTRG